MQSSHASIAHSLLYAESGTVMVKQVTFHLYF